MTGAHDWSAGILACHAADFAASNHGDLGRNRLFVLRTHAGRDACAPVKILRDYNCCNGLSVNTNIRPKHRSRTVVR
jgi:hypothetical protein